LKTEKKIRVAVIGLGKMGILHTALVNMIPQARLAALFDIDKKLSKYIDNSGLQVPFYTDLDRMLDEVELDAAVICTPTYTNLPMAEALVKRRIDLLVEKPLAHSLEAAEKMAALAAEAGIIHATGYLLAHVPLYRKVKGLLADRILGRVFRFRSSIYISEVFSRKKGWFYSREKSGGGVVTHIASHLIYLLYSYFGPVADVFARTQNLHSEVEDCATAILEFADGTVGTLDVSWSIPGYRLTYIDLIIEGENGTIEITNDYIKLYLYKPAREYPKEWTNIYRADLPSCSDFELGGEGFYEEDKDFVMACLERRPAAVTWQDGLEVQRIVEAIYRSAESRKIVDLRELGG
jgi:predicted dehydrogenase